MGEKQGLLQLKTIYELLGKQFVIPSYQRGYRWTQWQVKALLDDLWDFKNKQKDKEFYCLQPVVVVKNNDGKWEVIDGQQRLTTIFIVIKCLTKKRNINFADYYKKELYTIEYATRKGSGDWLEKITDGKTDDSNPDYYYMRRAYDVVSGWVDDKNLDGDELAALSQIIVGKESRCKVIWYEAEKDAKGSELFTRLNVGKIPLTNSELVKALFLSKTGKDESVKKEIALIWDEMEQQLCQPDFWAFATNENAKDYPNKIELLFNIIAEIAYKHKNDLDDFRTFNHFVEE